MTINYRNAIVDLAEALSGVLIVGRLAGSQVHLKVTFGPKCSAFGGL